MKAALYAKNKLEQFEMVGDHHGYGTRNTITISYPLHRSALYEASPKYVASNVYNRLPKNLRQIDDPKSFKKALKSFLYEKAYYSVDEL
ncbi:hypothetical protein HHI36_009786 [Cryptolaemus montrouzieri]|uniref:Uncharacterized protein n=1 Tax=Cryptolaemus montrouzieri TaxID=559131 RepID=A0ABD2MGS5_9CUCU